MGLGWIGLGAGVSMGVLLARGHASWPIRLAIVAAALAALGPLTRVALRFVDRSWPDVETRDVAGGGPIAGTPPVLVIFVAPLSPTIARWEASSMWLETVLGVLVFVGLSLAIVGGRDEVGLGVLVMLWVMIALRVAPSAKRIDRAGSLADPSGLAVLVELARTWPKGTSARLEARFVATGGDHLDLSRVEAIGGEPTTKPTLVVCLGPGLGSELALASRGLGDLADSAAVDLWIPHRWARRPAFVARAWRAMPPDRGLVCLRGGKGEAGPARIEPEALGRAAQLATEIALRWARIAANPPAPRE